MKKVEISIVIVHYKVEKQLLECLKSIIKSNIKYRYEIIVVDNDEERTIDKELRNKFPSVLYFKNSVNNGFGGGSNLGIGKARGSYIYLLNPDTIVLKNAINEQYEFIKKHKKAGIVSSLILNKEYKPYPLQGTEELTPFKAAIVYSWVNKIFPKNRITSDFWLKQTPLEKTRLADVVPLSSSIIKKSLLEKIGCFDENMFLYFEEYDLSKRIKKLGFKNYILPSAKVIHVWGESTKKEKNIEKIFSESRFYYLRKYFGLFPALLVSFLLSVNKKNLILFLILAVAFFLRTYKLSELMAFFGDIGWFYLSAKEMFLTGKIPLIGITSSHVWLHQGPIWTYLLGLVLWVFRFNPLSGAYLIAVLGTVCVYLVYRVCSELFSFRTGIIASALYATSPLVVVHARMPYITSLIPIFVLLFIYSFSKWLKGRNYYFCLSVFSLAILYNLELATVILGIFFLGTIFYFFFFNKCLLKKLLKKKIIALSLFAFVVPMLPIIVYDFQHNFVQTLGFGAWIAYRFLVFFGLPAIHQTNQAISAQSLFTFLFFYYQKLIFLPSAFISSLMLLLPLVAMSYFFLKTARKDYLKSDIFLTFLLFAVVFIGFMVANTPSEAYLPLFFPIVIIILAYAFDLIVKIKYLRIPLAISLLSITLLNSLSLISSDYFVGIKNGYGPSFASRLNMAKRIIVESENMSYNLYGKGRGSEFASFTSSYEYLLWWLGRAPSAKKERLAFYISETDKYIFLDKRMQTEDGAMAKK